MAEPVDGLEAFANTGCERGTTMRVRVSARWVHGQREGARTERSWVLGA